MYPDTTSIEARSNPLPTESNQNQSPNSLLYTLSLLKQKVNQVHSLVSIFLSDPPSDQSTTDPVAVSTIASLLQEIIFTASSVMFTFQQMTSSSNNLPTVEEFYPSGQAQPNFFPTEMYDQLWFGDEATNGAVNAVIRDTNKTTKRKESSSDHQAAEGNIRVGNKKSANNYDVIELDAAYLLAKYTHYCQICGKGFKRDANLRMHMRAHGDEYKTNAALSNPTKNNDKSGSKNDDELSATKYSCPQEGCRWNQRHAKFQPLKSMICVKNHYKRSHCPKMYVCKKCNSKKFSVLSDLRTHEKHCGDLKWLCSCGTTFSRKDKLMGHVTLFVGHTPAVARSLTNSGKMD